EFQDTDPVQWDIFSELFLHPVTAPEGVADQADSTALVFVGDPKQAIYAFRGANIHTYLDAIESVGDQRELTTNHRSDGALLHAIGTLLDGTTFGEASIGFTPVAAAERSLESRLNGPEGVVPALSIRLVHGPDVCETKSKSPDKVTAPLARRAIYGDLVSHVRDLLDREHLIPQGANGKPPERVVASHIAVLVKSGNEANDVQCELLAQGIPAVLARGTSVLRSPAGEQWRWLLEALSRPSDPARARTFALSWFEGRSVEWLDASTDDDMAAVHDRLHQWSATLATSGLAALLRRLWSETGVAARVLARSDGDRALTDLEHVAELLRTEAPSDHPSAASLLALLDEDLSEPDLNTDRMGDKASRRVESDADSVQIMTVWVAKGLEFPIVLCPTMWSNRSGGPVIYQDEDSGRRVCDAAPVVGKPPPDPWPNKSEADARKGLADRERDGESLRLLYVALTRARHQTVVWWAPVQGCNRTGLARVLFARADQAIDPAAFAAKTVKIPPPGETLGLLRTLMAPAGDAAEVIEVHPAGAPPEPRAVAHGADGALVLAISTLDRLPDRSSRRWSFTAITSGAVHVGASASAESTEDVRVTVDEPVDDDVAAFGGEPPASSSPSIVPDGCDRAPSEASRPEALTDAPTTGAQGQLAFPSSDADSVQPTELENGVASSGAFGEGGADATSLSPLAWLPAGAEFGTLVHSVFEHVDPSTPDLDTALAAEVERQLGWRNLDLRPVAPVATAAAAGEAAAHPELDPDRATDAHGRALLVAGLRTAIDTPLGPLVHHRTLRNIGAGDRLAELGFDLRLAGPAADGAARPLPSVRRIGEIVLRHLDAHDPYRAWAQDLAAGAIDVSLAGHLTGEIDAVLRVRPDGGGPERFVVVDYKTNRLHERGREPQSGAYGPRPLVEAMHHSHYPLQALLYLVALHRYLRWRQPDYDPTVHLGGAAYLFVRGMTGPGGEVTGGVPHGVASWPVPPVLVAALSDLLAGQDAAS
ncbi:MAG: UvrD-helicase domain-containing protein, partial [Aquihabitans sp.]